MQTERVEVTAGGSTVSDWQVVRVRAAMNEACRSFTLEFSGKDRSGAKRFPPFSELKISASGDPLFNGHVYVRKPHLSAKKATLHIAGRSKGAKAVDCSADHKTGRFEKKDPLAIAKELDEDGDVEWSSDIDLDKLDEYQIQPGASPFREVERLCREQGATLSGQPNGGIKITNASKAKKHAGGLYEGQTVIEWNCDHNCENRHKKTKVRGQKYDGHGKDNTQIEQTAPDDDVSLNRTRILVMDGDATKARAKKRAETLRDRAAGAAIRATALVVGWRDENGTLWTPGYLVWTESDFNDLAQDMLIEAVDYEQTPGQGDHGTTAHLHLVDPRAYGGKAGKGNKSGSMWGVDDSEAT